MSRELTRQEKAAIRSLVKRWCANYDKDIGCLPLDAPCYMLGKCWTGLIAATFRSAVLPLDPVLERSLTVETVHGNPALPGVRQGISPGRAAAVLLPGLRRGCPAGAEADIYAPQAEVVRGKIAPENTCIYKAFRGAFGVGGMFSVRPCFCRNAFHIQVPGFGTFCPEVPAERRNYA